ncbi:MAG: NAD(P)H-dependent glycerol-3-phosphate dehydrogenase [Desulfovibrionaceae bacterium]
MQRLQQNSLHIVVVGGGSWGTALAHLLAVRGHVVRVLLRDARVAASINIQHENPRYLAGYALHSAVQADTDASCVAQADLLLLAVPCQQLRACLGGLVPYLRPGLVVVNAAKGLELHTNNTMEQVVNAVLHALQPVYAILSGPSFAAEVMKNQPTAVVLGCADEAVGARLRKVFSTSWFRCYSSTDVRGVELGGAMKNVMAIAAGMCDGLGLGHNSRAALMTRGLAEMRRLGVALGAQERTFMGLSGLGDLTLTCTGDLSRNRQVGLRLGQGENLEAITRSLGMVAEGVKTAEALQQVAQTQGVSAPITEAVCGIVQGHISVGEAVVQLMTRALKEE